MNLHEVLMELGSNHLRMNKKGYSDLLSFNLKERTIRNGNIILVERGKIIPQTIKIDEQELKLDDDWGLPKEEFYSGLEKRYADYYVSVPNKHDKYQRSNFIAKIYEELTIEEMIVGKERAVARYELEWWVMANAVTSRAKWNRKDWFWKSEKHPKLILFREDIEGVCY